MAIGPDTPVEEIPTPDNLKPLFEPIKFGAFEVSTRIVYPPLTRCRSINTVPVPFMADYYAGVHPCHACLLPGIHARHS